ncbi:BOW99_gp33 family protein [Streptococcus cuniculi]|uniref:BOW99_gp33 family protein n=1 Tax=Streptococcus cuniculi TaxID=1432788 RepID=UPI000AA1774B
MKKEKTQQVLTVRCFLPDGTEVNPADIVIPKEHSVYQTLIMLSKNKTEKTA